MLCIGIAFLFWLFTKLSYVYRSSISIRVEYAIAKDKVLTVPAPDHLEIDVEASGWDLLFLFFSSKKYQIDVDLSDNMPKNVNSLTIKAKIIKQLPDNVNILEIRPDLIQFSPESIERKEVPIVLDNRLELSNQYTLKDSIILEPQTVIISGPTSIIREIKSWKTAPLLIPNLESNFKQKLGLKAHENKNVVFSPTKVTVIGKVEQVTEKSIEIDIIRRGVADSVLLVLLPKKVTISCIVGLSDFDLLSAEQFTAVADFSKINVYEQSEIRIELEEFPDYVKQINIQPKSVVYIIRSRAKADR